MTDIVRYLLTKKAYGKNKYGSVIFQAKRKRFVWTENAKLAERFKTLEEIHACVKEHGLLKESDIAIIPENWIGQV